MSNEENYNIVISALRDSNIAEFQNIMSDKDILSTLLGRPTTTIKKEDSLLSLPKADKARVLSAVSDILQAITSEAMTTSEMLEMLYTNYEESQVNEIAKFIKIVHSDYKVKAKNNKDIQISDTPFTIKYSEAVPKKITTKNKKTTKYLHSSSYGLVKTEAVNDFYKANSKKTGTKTILQSLLETTTNSSTSISPVKNNVEVFNVDTIVNKKIEDTETTTTQSQAALTGEIEHVNKIKDGRILANKTNPSLSYILVDSADLRIGTRNTLELSTFFNMLSTIELSKCQPYFNAVFLLPGEVTNPASGKVFKTASITQFFDGTPYSDDLTSQNYKTLEASFVRVQKTREGEIDTRAVNTNMSAFTMPQTINRFDEVFVGHNENVKFFENDEFRRATSIHDYTRPFMTIKSFDIDVAPTQGLMSFKTGKLSLILHDRTRMTDIAPFIKPDLFGSFGAEIAIEYGWSHIDAGGKINYLGDFLNNSRVTEKYIITNSSFSMDNNGQVNIDLSIAMRGPIDVKNVVIKSDPPGEISKDATRTASDNLRESIRKLNENEQMNINLSDFFSIIRHELTDVTGSADQIKSAPFTQFNVLKKNYHSEKRFKNKIKKIKGDHNKLNTFLNDLLRGVISGKEVTLENLKQNSSNNKSKAQNEDKKEKPAQAQTAQQQAVDPATSPAPPAVPQTKTLEKNQVKAFVSDFKTEFPKLMTQINAIINYKNSLKNKTVSMLKKIVGGLDIVDPFYNKEWLRQYHRIIKKNSQIDAVGFDVIGIGGNDSTNYVSFGSFLTGLIGTHMTCTGKFDEIQIVSYTANEFCGLMSNLNVSSFLLPRVGLSTFLEELFQDGTSITIESLITQVIERFISTRLQICYGLSEFYTRDAANNTIVKSKTLRKDSKKLKTAINKQLAAIYTSLATNSSKAYTDEDAPDIDDVKFVMPKVKFTFDTMTSKKSGYQRTICRLSIFDENDNPFGSVHSIMKKVYDEDGIVGVSAKLNRLRTQFKVGTLESSIKKLERLNAQKKELSKNNKKLKKKDLTKQRKSTSDEIKKTQIEISKIQQQLVRSDFYKRQGRIIDKLISEGKLVKINDETYKIVDNFQLSTIKNSLKNIMPSITYGSQNSAVIDASVTTVNEAKLNTVYLTRSDRNSGGKTQETKVQFQKDLPLRVLPSQASVTIFGCPFVNFAQYLFLDFETGTTVDNAYAVTGIKHSLSPGKFTTSLTLSYGDVYGKYENAAKTVQRAVDDQSKKDKLTKDKEKQNDAQQIKVLSPIKNFTKNKPTELKSAVTGVNSGTPSLILRSQANNSKLELNFKLNAFIYDSDVVAIDKSQKEDKHTINFFHMFNYDKNKDKKVQVDLDLKKVDQAAYKKINEMMKATIIFKLKNDISYLSFLIKIQTEVLKNINNKKLIEKHKFIHFEKYNKINYENIYEKLEKEISLQYDVKYQDRKSFNKNIGNIKIKAVAKVEDKDFKAIYSEIKNVFENFKKDGKLSIILTDKGIEIEEKRRKKVFEKLIPFENIISMEVFNDDLENISKSLL